MNEEFKNIKERVRDTCMQELETELKVNWNIYYECKYVLLWGVVIDTPPSNIYLHAASILQPGVYEVDN